MLKNIFISILFFLFISVSAVKKPFPSDTKAVASFRCDKGKGPAMLLDGKSGTWMTGSSGTCQKETQQTSVFLNFKNPLQDLAGVVTGESDKYGNYFPKEMEFYIDTNGDGRFDTFAGKTNKLGAGKKAVGVHKFNGRVKNAFGLEIRVTRQNVRGSKRAWTMNSLEYWSDAKANLLEETPYTYRTVFYEKPLPADVKISSSFKVNPKVGLHLLTDKDPGTSYQSVNGTLAKPNRPASLYLRFSKPQKNLMGLKILGNDKYSNYAWQRMEILADTNGNGKYDKKAALFTSNKIGQLRFKNAVEKVYGLQLKVTKQKNAGGGRAFIINEISDLIFKDDAGSEEMRFVVEDFEDFGTWRTGALNTGQPAGERYFGGYVFLTGALRPELAKNGQGVGIMRYSYKDGKGPFRMWCSRAKIFKQPGIIDKLSFWVNPQGMSGHMWFELKDASGKKITTGKVPISGSEWQQKYISVTPKTVPAVANAKYPLSITQIIMSNDKPGSGDVLLDDITMIGAVDRSKRITVKPVWQGLGYDPDKDVQPLYQIRNSLPTDQSFELKAELFRSVATESEALKTLTVPVQLKAYETKIISIDLGRLEYDHYQLRLSVETDKIALSQRDFIAVFKPNGGRINKSPMWIGSQHFESWTSAIENDFIYKKIAVPLGMDCYRTGSPNDSILETDLLLASGFGRVPAHLLKKGKKDGREAPEDFEKYAQWVAGVAKEKFAPHKDKILSVEFYNEPDLPDFCYLPGIDTYLKHWRSFAKGFKKGAPGVPLGTGSATVEHAHAKKDFNRRMYTELAKEADVAVWHAHGTLDNYTSRHMKVENWLQAGGLSHDKIKMGNSEAAIPSGLTNAGFIRQAVNLVQKIGWAKSHKESYFYTWFQTNDYHDQDLDSSYDMNTWGLVDSNQRIKPSGQAMNELIRQLANTKPLGSASISGKLKGVTFLKESGKKLWLLWPAKEGENFRCSLSSNSALTLVNIFGKEKKLQLVEGNVSFLVEGTPFYIEGESNTELSSPKVPEYVSFPDQIPAVKGEKVSIPVKLKSIWQAEKKITVSLLDNSDRKLSSKSVELATGGKQTIILDFSANGSSGYSLKMEVDSKTLIVPLNIVVPHALAELKKSPTIDGKTDISGTKKIILSKRSQIRDLVDDPNTPYWSGKNDLSAEATLANSKEGIYLFLQVTDQSHNAFAAAEYKAKGDSLSAAIFADGAHTEFTLSASGKSHVSINADDSQKGELKLAHKVLRQGKKTAYEIFIPFSWLGAKYKPGKTVKMAFQVNEDDGRGRVRFIQWNSGVESRDPSQFGTLRLQ